MRKWAMHYPMFAYPSSVSATAKIGFAAPIAILRNIEEGSLRN